MRVVLQAAGLGALRSADLDLGPGRYVVLSSEPGTLPALTALLAGRAAPRRGRVLLDGVAPASAPALRRRVAAVFEDEGLPPASSVLAGVELALSLRGQDRARGRALLASAGLEHLAALAPAALTARDLRAVALALALAHDQAALLVLHEPLSSSLSRQALLEGLERHTLRGATIVSTTASSADAAALGGEWLSIELGRLAASAPPRLGAGPWQQVVVACADSPALARALHDGALGLAVEVGVEPGTLRVTGSALDATVSEVIRLARERELEIFRIEPIAPPVEVLLAARAGFARGAYEAARVAALGATAPQVASAPPTTSATAQDAPPPGAST